MIIEVRKNGNKLGIINFSPEGGLSYVEEPDIKFKSWIESLSKNGIERLIDVSDKKRYSLTIIEQWVARTDPNFSIALREHLERSGYEIVERRPEVEKEVARFLAGFPDDNPDKKDILKRLPNMSHLEQTTILEGLRTLNNADK